MPERAHPPGFEPQTGRAVVDDGVLYLYDTDADGTVQAGSYVCSRDYVDVGEWA